MTKQETEDYLCSLREFVIAKFEASRPEAVTPPERLSPLQALMNHMDDIVDCVDCTIDQPVDEAVTGVSDIEPVYILITNTNSPLSKVIKGLTGTKFSHASISFDLILNKMYSFGLGDEQLIPSFAVESVKKTYVDRRKNVPCELYAVMMPKGDTKRMKLKLDEYIANHKAMHYSTLGLIGYLMNKPIEMTNKMFCSQFVDSMFKSVGADITGKHSALVHPSDFGKLSDSRVYKIWAGEIRKYDIIEAAKNLKLAEKLYIQTNKSVVNEAKRFPLQFDGEGNLIIKNIRKLDFNSEYAQSHKLLDIYSKNNNLEGMKYELSKLWFLNNTLERRIYSDKTVKSDRTEYIKVRARILNDFNKYLKLVTDHDSGFNFVEYYQATPFNDDSTFISKHTVSGIGKMIKGFYF